MAISTTTFAKGRRKTGGRRRGTANRATASAKGLARELICDPEYRENLSQAFARREVPPVIEALIWHYAFGRPPQMPFEDIEEVAEAPRELKITVVRSRPDPRDETGTSVHSRTEPSSS